MQRVTLKGIKRRGLAAWKARDWWNTRRVRIWSDEHRAWWRPNGNGYTTAEAGAGVYDFPDAYDRTKHCGPEKRICFFAVRAI